MFGNDLSDSMIENSKNLHLFYNFELENYTFKIKNGCINAEVLEFNAANNYDYDHLIFSNLHDDLKEYQLEKGSIIWKIRIEELEKREN